MKFLICTLFCFLSFLSFSQSDENGSLKVEFNGYVNGKPVILLINKEACVLTVDVQYTSADQYKTLAPNSVDTMLITLDAIGKEIKVKATTNCGTKGSVGELRIILTSIILPIKFTSFTADSKGLLKWTTEETNGSYFIIYRSDDGAAWKVADLVRAGLKSYTYTDPLPAEYYQIASKSQDGTVTYSNIVKVHLNKNATAINVFVYNITGRLIATLPDYNLSSLSTGFYILNDGKRSTKIFKN